MELPPPTTVALRTSSPERACAWRAAILQAELRLWQPGQPGPLTVLLSDAGPHGPESPSTDGWPPETPEVHPPGTIQVGGSGPADVVLPADASPREIGLACQLLGQLVQLRWRLREREQLQQRLTTEARTDPLSGLANRRVWDEALAALGNARPGTVCLAILDLDHFKEVNDRHGHPRGDAVLRVLGRTLEQSLRTSDLVARLGGDEFGLLLTVPTAEAAAAVVQRVRRRLPVALAEAGLPPVTASAGYCVAGPERLGDSQALVQAADQALQQAKTQGRDRSVGAR